MIGEYESVGKIIELPGNSVAEVLLIRIRTIPMGWRLRDC